MNTIDNFPVSFFVYASASKGECSRYCRVTFDKPINIDDGEFLYGRLSLKTKSDIDRMISTAECEQRSFPGVKRMLEELKNHVEVSVTHTTAQLVLKDLFSCALSMNFPQFSPIVQFDFSWFPESRKKSDAPVRVTVTF